MFLKGSMFKVSQPGNRLVDSLMHLSRRRGLGDHKKDLNKIDFSAIQVSLRQKMTKKQDVSRK